MIIYVDIDDTICYHKGDRKAMKYEDAFPIQKNIDKVNKLYNQGHEITYWTSRGAGTGIDWTDVTKAQLKKWGAKYHHLIVKKPFYHMFIDDRSINSLWDWDETSLKRIEDTHKW